jgi:hypothetical protein
MMDNGPKTEALKLSRLPKWAQQKSETMQRHEEMLKKTIADLEGGQCRRRPYHDYTISTQDFDGVTQTTRYFVASDIDVEMDNGLTVNLSPRDGQVRIMTGVKRAAMQDGSRWEAVILPRAGNSFNICAAQVKEN